MTVRFLEVAQGELDEAIAYYNSQVPGSRWASKCDAAGCGGSPTD